MAPLSPLHVEGCARLNRARLKAFRLNVYEATTGATIDGGNISGGPGVGLRIKGAAITHLLNDQPDTASFRASGGVSVRAGQLLQVTSGDYDTAHVLFSGRILQTSQVYESLKQNVARDLHCVDPTWLLQRRKVLATYVNLSATAIATDLIARFSRGFTGGKIVLGLPVVDAITFTNESLPQCLTALCERIGGSWYVDWNNDLHLFLTESEAAAPITDATPRTARNFALAEDLSQVMTRIIGRGGGAEAAIDVAAGATELPVDEGDAATWYDNRGGLVEVNAQRISYLGVAGRGGVGALIGTGNTPTTALVVSGVNGAGLAAGTYQYAETFANASGETPPGPARSVTVGGSVPPLNVIAARRNSGASGGLTPGGIYSYRVALLYAGGGYALGPPTAQYYTPDNSAWEIGVGLTLIDPVSGFPYYPSLMSGTPAEILQTQIFRTLNGGTTYYSCRSYAGVAYTPAGWLTATDFGNTDSVIVNFPQYPTGPIAGFGRVVVKAPIPAAPPGFTSAHLYRTAANGTQLKRLATSINTATDYLDSATDATLGANAPTADTSGVVSNAALNVAAGSSEIIVTGTQPFANDGGAGWARIGDLVIRYTGIGTNKLTGVPTSGPGSLTATVRYGAQILVQPRLVGVNGIATAIRKGDTVTLRVEVEDAAAITAMAERLKIPGQAAVTDDGIIEDVVSDSRFGLVELTAQCLARLAERKDPWVTVTFETRDDSLQVGRLVTINVTQPPIAGTFRVQKITFSEIAITGGLARVRPLRTVEATNKLFTFPNLLRQLRGREGGVP